MFYIIGQLKFAPFFRLANDVYATSMKSDPSTAWGQIHPSEVLSFGPIHTLGL